MGQLLLVLRAKFLLPAIGLNKIQGQPFKVAEVMEAVQKLLGEERRRAPSQSDISSQERAVQ